jgi:hypothetical protein
MQCLPIAGRALFLEGSHASPVCPSGKSNMWMKMSMEHCWNDTDKGKLKYLEKSLSYCHFFHTNLTRRGLGSNKELRGERKATNPLFQ